MTLPVINTPTYELEIPSTKETITFRPFLVKEEKILLIAMEEDNEKSIVRAVRQIVTNCTMDTVPVDSMPMFDLEYIFLNIRAKSVGEEVKINLLCPDDEETYVEVSIPLEEINVEFIEGHTNTIKLTDNISIQMSYPTFEMIQIEGLDTTKGLFKLVGLCIHSVIEGETIHERTDFTEKDLNTFLDSMNSANFKDIQTFFETMPKLKHEVEFENPKTNKMQKATLEGMQSFFE